jgi:site-specific recombinase XerD
MVENPVHEAVQEFLAFCAARNDSEHTLRGYNSDLLSFVQCIGHETPVTETRKRIRQYVLVLDTGLADRTIRRKIASIRSFSNWLYNERNVDISPAEGFTNPCLKQALTDIPSEADMTKLLSRRIRSACRERDFLVLELLHSCGVRASEGLASRLLTSPTRTRCSFTARAKRTG